MLGLTKVVMFTSLSHSLYFAHVNQFNYLKLAVEILILKQSLRPTKSLLCVKQRLFSLIVVHCFFRVQSHLRLYVRTKLIRSFLRDMIHDPVLLFADQEHLHTELIQSCLCET